MQTFVIGLVVLLSTTTIVVALALLRRTSAPFDRAFARQPGAHAVAAVRPGQVTDANSWRPSGPAWRRRPDRSAWSPSSSGTVGGSGPPGPLTVVGRAEPGGAVDRLDLWQGRWPAAPGEIVLNEPAHGPGRARVPTGSRE